MSTSDGPAGASSGLQRATAGGDAVPRPRPPGDDEDRRRADETDAAAHAARERGEYDRARLLDEELLDRRRRSLGDDHPETLAAATGLAIDLTRLGEFARARALSEQTLARQRRVLGEDHADTLVSAVTLAITLRRLGNHVRARRIGRWVADRTHARGPG